MFKRYGILSAFVMSSLMMAACGTAPLHAENTPAPTASRVIRIAAVLPGRVDDLSFNQLGYEGLQRVKSVLASGVEFKYTENVYNIPDIEPALRDYASAGYDLVIGHGFQFQDPIMALAPQYPNVNFAIGPGAYETSKNVGTYDADNAQVGYILGTVAGLMTKSNIVAVVAGVEVPNVHAQTAAFKLAVQAINPNAKVLTAYTGSFSDAAAASEATKSMIEQGADVVFAGGDGMAAGSVGACRDAGVYVVSNNDLSALAPKVFLATATNDYSVPFLQMVSDIKSGSFGAKAYTMNLQNGGLSLKIILDKDVQPVRAQIDSVIQGLKSGSITMPAIPTALPPPPPHPRASRVPMMGLPPEVCLGKLRLIYGAWFRNAEGS